jgi:hypothetical protein
MLAFGLLVASGLVLVFARFGSGARGLFFLVGLALLGLALLPKVVTAGHASGNFLGLAFDVVKCAHLCSS